MRQSRLIFTLTILAFCSQVLSQSFLAKEKTLYAMTFTWPVNKSFNQEKFIKQDYPCFDSKNFAIKEFYPTKLIEEYNMVTLCTAGQCPTSPLNVGKIQESDYQYLDKYFYRFGQNAHNSTKELWNSDGSCFNKTQTEYFSTMVKLHKKFNIVSGLAAKNIVPHKTKMYKVEDVSNALTQMFGGQKPVMRCTGSFFDPKTNTTSPSQLIEFSLVVDEKLNPTKAQVRDCYFSSCYGEVNFPPIEY